MGGGGRRGGSSSSSGARPPERVGPPQSPFLPLAGAGVGDRRPPGLGDALVRVGDVVGAADGGVDERAEGRRGGERRVPFVEPRPREGRRRRSGGGGGAGGVRDDLFREGDLRGGSFLCRGCHFASVFGARE